MTDKAILDQIVQITVELDECGTGVIFFGWTDDDDRSYMATIALPKRIRPAEFLVAEWRKVPLDTLEWSAW